MTIMNFNQGIRKISRLLVFCLATLALRTLGLAGPADLAFTATAPETVLPYSPVEVTLQVVNKGAESVTLVDFPHTRLTRVEVFDADADEPVHSGLACPTGSPPGERFIKPVQLEPGQHQEFTLVLANRWSEDKKLLGPMFPAPGTLNLVFSYPLVYQENGVEQFVQLKTLPLKIEVVPPAPEDSEARQALSASGSLAWTLEPKAGLRQATDGELVDWEKDLRRLINDNPESPWVSLQRFALAEILWDRSLRRVKNPSSLRRQAADLVSSLDKKPDFPHRHDLDLLKRQLEKHSSGRPVPAEDSTRSRDVFEAILRSIEEGKWSEIKVRLDPEFTYNGQLDGKAWLRELKANRSGLGAGSLKITPSQYEFGSDGDLIKLDARVTFESGKREEVQEITLLLSGQAGNLRVNSWKSRRP